MAAVYLCHPVSIILNLHHEMTEERHRCSCFVQAVDIFPFSIFLGDVSETLCCLCVCACVSSCLSECRFGLADPTFVEASSLRKWWSWNLSLSHTHPIAVQPDRQRHTVCREKAPISIFWNSRPREVVGEGGGYVPLIYHHPALTGSSLHFTSCIRSKQTSNIFHLSVQTALPL